MRLLVVVGHRRRETSLLSPILWRLPVEPQVSFPKFQNSLYFKILQARKKIIKSWFFLMLAAGESEGRPWVPVRRTEQAHGTTPSAADSCSSSLPAQPSQGSPRGPAALRKQTIRSGFFQHLPDSCKQAARGVAAPSLHNGRDLTAADGLQGFTDRGLVAISPFGARCSPGSGYAKPQFLPIFNATGENVLPVSNHSAIWSGRARLILVMKRAKEFCSTFRYRKMSVI